MIIIKCDNCGHIEHRFDLLEVRFLFCDCGGEYFEYEELPCPHYPDEGDGDE